MLLPQRSSDNVLFETSFELFLDSIGLSVSDDPTPVGDKYCTVSILNEGDALVRIGPLDLQKRSMRFEK